MHSQLSLEQAPPLSVPVRFFLSAPLFGVLAAAVLFVTPEAMATRWSPALLAVTHLLTLGALTMVMFGALFQMLPVLAGSPVSRSVPISTTVHLLLVLGTLGLAAALSLDQSLLGGFSLVALTTSTILFIIAVGSSLARAPRLTQSVLGMQLALLALLVTITAGLLLLAGHLVSGLPLYRPVATDIHASWGLLGWVGLLIVAVSYQVVPMFQMTPPYAKWVSATLVPLLFVLLLAWSLWQFWSTGPSWPAGIATLGLVTSSVFFATYTLRLQQQRRRRIADVTLNFWRLGLCALAGAGLIWFSGPLGLIPDAWETNRELMLGVLTILVFAFSIVNGMLYKILPFLLWFHLQSQTTAAGQSQPSMPKMREIIPTVRMRWQFRLHLATCLLSLTAVVMPQVFTRPAAAVMCASFLLLEYNLVAGYRLYVVTVRGLGR